MDHSNEKISCFYFEAFDEPWKDSSGNNPNGSENHFGLFTVDGKAKYALWENVDNGSFKGLTRNGNSLTKTYNGNSETLFNSILTPPVNEISYESKILLSLLFRNSYSYDTRLELFYNCCEE